MKIKKNPTEVVNVPASIFHDIKIKNENWGIFLKKCLNESDYYCIIEEKEMKK